MIEKCLIIISMKGNFFYLSIFDYLLIEKRNSHTNKQVVNEMEKIFLF